MQKNKNSFFHWLFLLLNIVAALLLIISYTAPYIDPAYLWYVAFIGLSFPFLVLTNGLFILYWLIRRRWHFMLSLVVISAGWSFILDVMTYHSEAKITSNSDSVLKVMTYNAHLFLPINKKQYDDKSRHGILEMITQEKPSVICFQEFYSRSKGTYNIKDSLIKLAGLKYYYLESFKQKNDEVLAMATFSKYPIVKAEVVPFFNHKHANMSMYTDVVVNSDTIRIINIHLQSINFQAVDYKYLDQVTREANANLKSSKRIGYRLKTAFIKRSKQAETVAEIIRLSPYPVIVCGDFNDTPISYAFNFITRSGQLKNTFREKGNGFGVTYGGAFPNFQIDYILCSPRFNVLSHRIIKKKYSDHYPVVAELSF